MIPSSPSNRSGFCVFDRDVPAAEIVVPQAAAKEVRSAADELARAFNLLGAGEVRVTDDSASRSTRSIHLGPTVRASGTCAFDAIPEHGFRIIVKSDVVIVACADEAETTFAVHHLLEKHCGVRWLWPGDPGTVVPSSDAVWLPIGDETVTPSFVWRELGPTGALWQQYGKEEKELQLGITEHHLRIYHQWERRNRFGGRLLSYGHIIGTEIIAPARFGADHPEYFALVDGVRQCDAESFDGKHGHQPCTTNPEVVGLMVDHLRARFDENPDLMGISVAMNDGRGFCECETCGRLDSKAPDGVPDGSLSHRIFTFTNAIAREVKKSHRDRFVVALAYHACIEPPAFSLEDNVLVLLCLNSAHHWEPEAEENSFRLIREWVPKAAHRGVYEYFIQGDLPDLPRINTQAITRLIRQLSSNGYRYFVTQAGDGFGINGLNYYLLSKLLWNPDLSVDAVVDDYCNQGFGAVGAEIKEYFGLLERAHRRELESEAPSRSDNEFLAVYTDELLERCSALLDDAFSRVDDDGSRNRLKYLKAGFTYWNLTMDALRASYEDTVRPLWQNPKPDIRLNAEQMDAVRRAKEIWDRRDEYVETIKNDFVVSYFWVRYNDFSRMNCGGIGQRIRALLGGDETGRFEENIKV